MLAKPIKIWFIMILIASMLGACGGGNDEPSNLLLNVGTTDNPPGGTPDPERTHFFGTITEVSQTLIPSRGRTRISILTHDSVESLSPVAHTPIVANATGSAIVENMPQTTNIYGEATFTVTDPVDENVFVTVGFPANENEENSSAQIPLYFGASVAVDLSPNRVAAGSDAALLTIFARDANDVPLENIEVELSFSLDSFAAFDVIGCSETNTLCGKVGVIENGGVEEQVLLTGVHGEFLAFIYNLMPQTIKVSPIIGGLRAPAKTIVFESGEASIVPTFLKSFVKRDNVKPDSKSKATIVFVATDIVGNPIPHIPIDISVDSATALLSIGEESAHFFISGSTGTFGSLTLDITNTITETITVSAVTTEGGQILETQQTIIFNEETTTTGSTITRIQLDQPLNNNQPANGEAAVSLRGRVFDEDGNPVPDEAVSIIVSGGSAAIEMVGETTDASGRFFANLTDTVAESFSAKAVVGEVESNTVSVRFVGTTTTVDGAVVGSMGLTPLPPRQLIDDGSGTSFITLIANVRDSNNTPLEGAKVRVSSNNSAVIFNAGELLTEAGGTARFQVISTTTGTFNITATAQAVDSEDRTVGGAVNASTSVTFYRESIQVDKLIPDVLIDNQPASGKDPVEIQVIARDSNNRVVEGVPITVRIGDGSTATANPARGETDANGIFLTQITSTQAGKLTVVFVAEDTNVSASKTVNFTAESGADSQPKAIELKIKGSSQQPADGQSTIVLEATPRDDDNHPIANIEVALITNSPNVPNQQGTTDALGVFRTTMVSTVAETITVTPVIGNIRGEPKTITFLPIGASATRLIPSVANDRQPATGSEENAITISVAARDQQGVNVAGVPIIIQMPQDTAATAIPFQGNTDENGLFTTKIISTEAGPVDVTITVKNTDIKRTQRVTFIAVSGDSAGTTLQLIEMEVEGSPQPADGTSKVTVIVTPRDTNGAPVEGVNVQLVADSNDAKIEPASGTTDALGVFRATITSEVAERFEMTPVAWKDGEENAKLVGRDAAEEIEFLAIGSSAFLDIDIIKNNQPATGSDEDAVQLNVIAKDAQDRAVANVPIVIKIPAGSGAVANPASGQTDDNGALPVAITSTKAGRLDFTVAIKNTSVEESVTVNFRAGKSDPEDANLEVDVKNDRQPATGEDAITMVVAAKDSGGTAIADVPLAVSLPPGTLAFPNPARGVTDENGVFTTEITSTLAGQVAVSFLVEGTDIASPPELITFIAQTGATPTTIELLALNAPQSADGESQINLVVTPRDARGTPIVGIDVELINRSNTAEIAEPKGTTDALGEFRTTVTNTVAETFDIVPVADPDGARIRGDAVPIIFVPVAVPIPQTLTLSIEGVNPQEVGGEVGLVVLARDKNRTPMGDVPITLFALPGEEPPDITGSALFGSSGFKGKTDANTGLFRTTISNSQAGTFKVQAEVTDVGLKSNIVEIIFQAKEGEGIPEVSEIKLIAQEPQLLSAGWQETPLPQDPTQTTIESVVITAILENKDNNLVPGALVNFSADSGQIQAIQVAGSSAVAGVTDENGRAQARLTTLGNPNNRPIIVTATVSTPAGEKKQESITIQVTGTVIEISGEDTVIIGSSVTLNVSLTDSAGNGIGNKKLRVSSALGNGLHSGGASTGQSEITLTTNATGQAQVVLEATHPGEDTITAVREGDPDGKTATTGKHTLNISADSFILEPDPKESDLQRIPLRKKQKFVVIWKENGKPKVHQLIELSSTRGKLSSTSVTTDTNGIARFTIESTNAGPALIKASVSGGPSEQMDINFVALKAFLMTLQTEPDTIGVNLPGAEVLEQSKIIATVRDPENNLVEGKRINFTLTDVTGGSLFPASDETDNFGRATTTYTSGSSSSAAEGVVINAVVTDDPTVTAEVKLTVAKKSLFITLGTGNEIGVDGVRYNYPYTVLVNDAAGVAVPDVEVTLTVLPLRYYKGAWEAKGEEGEGKEGWVTGYTLQNYTDPEFPACINEDRTSSNPKHYFNGILDKPDESDFNNNNRLDPGGVVTLSSGVIRTNENGFADFDVIYAKENAGWVDVRLTATTVVAGTESFDEVDFNLRMSAEDANNLNASPAGPVRPTLDNGFMVTSPFGMSTTCLDDL